MERTFHGLRAVNKYILATSAVESLPPQVEVENLTPVIGGKLRGAEKAAGVSEPGSESCLGGHVWITLLLSNSWCTVINKDLK